jgi:hypothetical protein
MRYNPTNDFTRNIAIADRNGSKLIRTWAGNDSIVGGCPNGGVCSVDGGLGVNTMTYPGNRANYTITQTASGVTIRDDFGAGGTDNVKNIQVLTFADTTLNYATAIQSISFGSVNSLLVGNQTVLSDIATSGLPVSFASSTIDTCTVEGSTVTGIAAGTCTISASQAGNNTYSAATPVNQNITVITPTDIPRLVNIATRAKVLTADDVMIAGFIIGGNQPKKVLIRARGPSLAAAPFNVPGTLSDPVMTLYSGQTVIDTNNNYGDHANAANIPASFKPTSALESAILTTLSPGAYTAIVTGAGAATGVAIVEVFEIDLPEVPLVNIATRSKVQSGDDVMIAGLIIQGNAPKTVLITARGPSMALPPHNVPGTLANPYLTIYSGQTPIYQNDNWRSNANAAAIQATGNAPSNDNEAALLITLEPGAYTAIVNGVGGTSGIGIVEVFAQ